LVASARWVSGAVGANGTAFAVEKQYAYREIFSKGSKFKADGCRADELMPALGFQQNAIAPSTDFAFIPA
jgi:hypothetical protein